MKLAHATAPNPARDHRVKPLSAPATRRPVQHASPVREPDVTHASSAAAPPAASDGTAAEGKSIKQSSAA